MTRNEYIAQLSVEAHKQGFWDNHLERAIKKADEIEAAGCAPWQDAPIGKPIPGSKGTPKEVAAAFEQYKQLDFDPPTRKEITADDVQPGAVFVLKDESAYEVLFVDGDLVKSYMGLDGGIYRSKYTSSMKNFVRLLNEYNATVTPPTA